MKTVLLKGFMPSPDYKGLPDSVMGIVVVIWVLFVLWAIYINIKLWTKK